MDEQKDGKLRSSFSTAFNFLGSLMFLQLLSRGFHFGLNSILTRFASPEEYGLSALQLPFIAMILTRIIREAGMDSTKENTASSAFFLK